MAKRRQAIPVTLNSKQRERLERLWFHFGNYDPKFTRGNHSFIQRFLENGIDERPLYTKRTAKSEIPTPECEAAVDAILSMNTGSKPPDEKLQAGGLRLISRAEKPQPTESDGELKAILDDMRRRYRIMHERLEVEGETPDAA